MKMALLLPTRLWPHEVSPEVVQLIPLSSALCSVLRQWLNEVCSSLGRMPSEIYFKLNLLLSSVSYLLPVGLNLNLCLP